MSITAFLLSAAVVTAQPGAAVANASDRTVVQCPPTPYYIVDREEPPVTSRVPDRESTTPLALTQKRPRPCYLTRGQGSTMANPFRMS